jgi:hypothetical protein
MPLASLTAMPAPHLFEKHRLRFLEEKSSLAIYTRLHRSLFESLFLCVHEALPVLCRVEDFAFLQHAIVTPPVRLI